MPVVPTKAMSLLERNLHDDDEMVRVSLRPNEVLIQDRAGHDLQPAGGRTFPELPGGPSPRSTIARCR